jgi:uncharacterized protein YbdZ (MbtH family)
MTSPFEDDHATYVVLVNQEGQYSLWPARQSIPEGWSATGPRGARRECLAWVDEHWTDLRPKSLIDAMHAASERART